jgi:hypothetical protein
MLRAATYVHLMWIEDNHVIFVLSDDVVGLVLHPSDKPYAGSMLHQLFQYLVVYAINMVISKHAH